MLISGVLLLQEHALSNTATRIRALMEDFNWELFDHPPYSRGMLRATTTSVSSWRPGCDHIEQVMESIKVAGKQLLIPRYDKCLDSGCDSFET
jgi:hypothetical protein